MKHPESVIPLIIANTAAHMFWDLSQIETSIKPGIKQIAEYNLTNKSRVKRLKNRRRRK